MAKTLFRDVLNKQLTEENQKLSNDLKLCQKKIEFLENYRKVLNQFNRNCVCDQNKITDYLFRSLERQYKQFSHNEWKRQSKTKKNDKSLLIITKTNPSEIITKNEKKRRKSESIKEISKSEQQINDNNECLPTTTIEVVNDIKDNPQKELSNQEFEAESQSPIPQPTVQSVVKPMQSSSSQITPEEDTDLTFPSFNDPIFSLNANYVEELAAQVVPKIEEQILKAPTVSQLNANEIQMKSTKTVQKRKLKSSGQTFLLKNEKQAIITSNSGQRIDDSDLISGKSNIKFILLLENLRNGRLQSFNDPNNDMISVFLKNIESNDGKKVSKIVYKCNYSLCGFETNSQQYIHRHIDRHKTSKFFRSSLIKYRTFSLLLEDLKNGKLESFIDPDYNLVLVTLKQNDSFEDQTQSELVFKCLYPNCQFETYGKYYIRSHVLRHNKVKTFACYVCQEKFGSKVSRVEHQIKAHNNYKNPLFKCDFPECGYKTTVRQSMEFHKMKHKSEKTFKCETNGCDLYFKSVYQMRNHMKRVHILKTVVCEWPGCEARFKTKYELQHHILSHTGEKITVTKIRDILRDGNFVSTVDRNNKLFSVIRQQIINERDGRIEIGPKLGYKCNQTDCRFVCITPHLISEHTLSHSKGKAYECDLCHKTYTLRNHLNNHKKLVHNINNKCPVLKCTFLECEYTTRNPYCFRQHERTHQTDTPFKCEESGCEKSFKTNISLRHHIRSCHTSASLLSCKWPGCKSTFKNKSYLNYHMKCHSKPRETYECQHCAKTFNFKANLTKHTKSQHIID